MNFKKSYGLKKMFAEMFVASGAWFFPGGIALVWTYAPLFVIYGGNSSSSNSSTGSSTESSPGSTDSSTLSDFAILGVFIAIIACFGALFSFIVPISVRRLYGGSVMESSPHLVGFQGTMPITKLEKIVFGNDNNRLSYEPSSTPFSRYSRNKKLRVGNEPNWVSDPQNNPIEPPVTPGFRLFTLADTGNLTVSIFEAVRPPTVALICGRKAEG